MKQNKLISILLASTTFSLVACNGGGGSSGGGSNPSPTPSPTPTPISTKLQALTITQDVLNIDKVGQHRLWHLTLTNPNNSTVYLLDKMPNSDGTSGNNLFSIDATTSIGPTNPLAYAVAGGNNNCLDYINNGTGLTAGQSCTYTFNAQWAVNVGNVSNYSFNLNYIMSDDLGDLTRQFIVKNNCVDTGGLYDYHCATGTNNSINYSLVNLNKKIHFSNGTGNSVFTSSSGNYIWYWTYTSTTSSINRAPVSYDANSNTLILQSPDYVSTYDSVTYQIIHPSLDGSIGYLNSGVAYGNNSWTDGVGYLPLLPNTGSGYQYMNYGLDGQLRAATGSTSSTNSQPVYIMNQSTTVFSIQSTLSSPVQFQGDSTGLYAVDANSNLFGYNSYDNLWQWGCFTKNGSGYDNWKKLDENGFEGFNPATHGYFTKEYNNQIYYPVYKNSYRDFLSTNSYLKVFYSDNFTDFNACQVSANNYLVEYNNGGNSMYEFLSTNQYVLVNSGDIGDYYYLPASFMSNGLDGQ